MGNNQAGSGKGQRLYRGQNGRRDGHPDRTRVRRAKSDVGSRRNLRVTKLSTQQTLSHKNLRNRDITRQLRAKTKARDIEAYEYFEDNDRAAKRYRLQSSDDEIEHWIQGRDSTSFTSAENSQVYLEEEDDVFQSPRHLRRPGECVTGLDDIKEMLTSLQKKFDEIPRTKTISRLRKSFKLRRSTSDVNVSYRGKETGESFSPNDDQKSSPYKKERPSERRSPHVVQQEFREPIVEDEMDALPRSPVTDHVKSRRKRHVPRTSQSRSSKLRRSVSDVDISYRCRENESPRTASKEDNKDKIHARREQLCDKETDRGDSSLKETKERSRRIRQRGDLQMSSNLRRSMSDVDVSYRGNRKGRTSPRPRPTRRPVQKDNDPEDTKCGDRADAAKKDDQRKQHSQEETSPTCHKRFLYNAPPVEFAEDSSEEKTRDNNPVIFGSFKAGEDTGRKGRDGRKPAEPVGAGAKVVTGLVDSVKQSLGIHEEDVIEGETTYRDQLPHLIQGWATRQYTDSKKDDDTGFLGGWKGRFNVFFGDESKGREREEQVILGSWTGGEDTGRQETVNDSGLINNLKQAFLESTGLHQPRGRKGGTSESPGFLGTWAGGEDSGRNHTDEPGPFNFLGGLRRSFRTSSGEDHPYGGEDEPVSPASVFTGTTMGGEDTGRNRKSGTSTSPSFMDYLPSFASAGESSDKQRDDRSWFSPQQWWTGEKDQDTNDSTSWLQNLQNAMQSPWGEDKRDENDEKARSVLDQWTGMDKARSVFGRWKDKTQNNSNSCQKRERGTRAEEKGLLDYLGVNQLLDGQKSQGRHPCGARGSSPRPRDKKSPFSFFS
ncbi:uncharacterized protein LOC144924927 isoform X1 [Branchiostoma floridae x Branchiostoma belcheri]